MSDYYVANPNRVFTYIDSKKWAVFDCISNTSWSIDTSLHSLLLYFSTPMDAKSIVKTLNHITKLDESKCSDYFSSLVRENYLVQHDLLAHRRKGFFRAPMITLKELIEANSTKPKIAFIGMPYDHGASVKTGSKDAPNYLREASNTVFSLCTNESAIDLSIYDLGNIKSMCGADSQKKMFGYLKNIIKILTTSHILPFVIGGDHSISYASISGILDSVKEIGIIQFDAHSDCYSKKEVLSFEDLYHGNFMNFFVTNEKVKDIQQIGLRRYANDPPCSKKIHVWYDDEIMDHIDCFLSSLNSDIPYYITIDVDVLSPSTIISTGTPLPGGLNYRELNKLINSILSCVHIKGTDVVELIPGHNNEGQIISGVILNYLMNHPNNTIGSGVSGDK